MDIIIIPYYIGPASNNDSIQDISKSSSATTPNPLPFPLLTPERPQMSYATINKMMKQYHHFDSTRIEATSSPSSLKQFRDHVSHLFKHLNLKKRMSLVMNLALSPAMIPVMIWIMAIPYSALISRS